MKPNRPSLILYLAICILVVFFKLVGFDYYGLYARPFIIAFIFIYYLITNEYKISWNKVLIFLFLFLGYIFNLLDLDISDLASLISFLVVNLLLMKLSYDDFRSLKFDESDRFSILILFLFLATACTSVLSLQFENIVLHFSLYIIYGIILSLLVFFAVTNYMKKPNFAFLNLVIMGICFLISDTFFMINKYYLSLFALSFIGVFVHVFSYYFMVTYFIERDKYFLNQIKQ